VGKNEECGNGKEKGEDPKSRLNVSCFSERDKGHNRARPSERQGAYKGKIRGKAMERKVWGEGHGLQEGPDGKKRRLEKIVKGDKKGKGRGLSFKSRIYKKSPKP